jgi:hypothetical protein
MPKPTQLTLLGTAETEEWSALFQAAEAFVAAWEDPLNCGELGFIRADQFCEAWRAYCERRFGGRVRDA